ncbi:MAG: A24 family peptidase [Ilumatobacteraceae bacterium]
MISAWFVMSASTLSLVLEVVFAVLGLLVGSHLAVLADRIPAGRPTSTGRSQCDSCATTLKWFELVPVLSRVVQRSRCRTCSAHIPAMSTVVELTTAALFAALAASFGLRWELGGYLVFAAGLTVLTVIDLRTQRLPRRIIYMTAALGAPFLVAGALLVDEPVRLQWAIYGSLGAVLFFVLLYLGWRGSMGDGDVRLAALIGLFLGWIGPMHVPVGLFMGFLAGAVVGSVLLARGASRRSKVAFGPYLALGAIATIFVGHPLIRLWLHQ